MNFEDQIAKLKSNIAEQEETIDKQKKEIKVC